MRKFEKKVLNETGAAIWLRGVSFFGSPLPLIASTAVSHTHFGRPWGAT
jgi:hypothetical protein